MGEKQKLHRQSGETLTETLVALLVITLSSVLLFTMVGAASHLNATARQQDDILYDALNQLARQEQAPPPRENADQVTIQQKGGAFSADFPVTYLGDDGGALHAYQYQKGGAEG